MKPKNRFWLCLALSGFLSLLQGCARVSAAENLVQNNAQTQTEVPQLGRLVQELAEELLSAQNLQIFTIEHNRIPTIMLGALEGEPDCFANADSYHNMLISSLLKSSKLHLMVNKAGFTPPVLPLEEEMHKLITDSGADFFLQSVAMNTESAPTLQVNLIDLRDRKCVWSGQRSVLIIKT